MAKRDFLIAMFVLVFLWGGYTTAGAQANPFDSLKHILKAAPSDEARVDILISFADDLYDSEQDTAFYFTKQAHELATAIKYKKGIKHALIFLGYRFGILGEFQKSLHYHRQAERVAPGEADLQGYNYVMMGNIYRDLGHYDSSEFFYKKAIAVLSEKDSPRRLAYVYKNFGNVNMIQWKTEAALLYLNKALMIYRKLNEIGGVADILNAKGSVYLNQSDFKNAKLYCDSALRLAIHVNDETLLARCYQNHGELYFKASNYSKSLEMLFLSLDFAEKLQHKQMMASTLMKIGEVYEEPGQNEISLQYFFLGLKLAEQIGAKLEIGRALSEVAWIYKNLGRYDLAMHYIERSFKVRNEIGDSHGLSNCYNIRGLIHYARKNYPEALRDFEKAISIRESINHFGGVTASTYNMALVYEDLGQLDRAYEYQVMGMEAEKKVGNTYGLGVSYNSLGSLCIKMGKTNEAFRYLQLAKEIGEKTSSKNILRYNMEYFSVYYEKLGNLKKAIEYQKLTNSLKDSLYSEASILKFAEMQALYQLEKKDQEIKLLNQNQEIQDNKLKLQQSRIRQQGIVIAAVIIGFVLVSALSVITYRYTKKIKKANQEITEKQEEIQAQSEELIEANQTIARINKNLEAKIDERTSALQQAYKELDIFFYRSSHDFRRPLTTFLGLSEVAKITVKDPNALELFAKVKETATNLDKMLVKLQSISDVGAQQLVYKEVLIKEIVDNVYQDFHDELQLKKIKTTCEVKLKNTFISYPAMVKLIVENLVENAIHFSGVHDPYVHVEAVQQGDQLKLSVQDNGQGIRDEYHDKIFEMYFRANERSKGNGLGLYIAKKAVEKLNGVILVNSLLGAGTTFTILLPLENHHHHSS
ncbi:MAG: tetratricopeptide repeat protein [Bacteroidota bacterium]